MKANDVFPSKYLKKEDIGNNPQTFTIDTVSMEDVSGDDGKERKAVMHFRGDQTKPMILNRGNWGLLEESYGEDSDDWAGKPVEVYVDPSVMFAGKRTGGLRVRIPSENDKPKGWATLDEALKEAAGAGLTKETIISGLKTQGITAWNPSKCTPIVRDMIEQATATPF